MAIKGKWQYLLLLNMSVPLYFMLQEPLHRLVPGVIALFAIALGQLIAVRYITFLPIITAIQLALMFTLSAVYHPMYLYLVFIMAYSFHSLGTAVLYGMTASFAAGAAGIMILSGRSGDMQAWFNMLPPLFGGCIMPYVIRVSAKYREMATRLQAATKQIERFAQQEERQRIARELHDTLGHTLSLIVLKSEVAEKLISRAPDRAAAEAREIRETASAGLKRMRELVTDMKVVKLAEEWEHARMLCAAANVQLDIHDRMDPEMPAITPLQESIIGMCVREAVTNIVRHSRATACKVELESDERFIRCTVSDNGTGMDGDPAGLSGNGLIGMKQRLALLEGGVQIESDRTKGTRLLMEIPIVRKIS